MEQRLLVGVFDIIHVGHLTQLESVAGDGQELSVAVLSDAGMSQLLNAEPFIPARDRVALLSQLRTVSRATVVGPETQWELPAHDRLFIDADLRHVLPAAFANPDITDVSLTRQPANPKLVAAARVA